MPDQKKHFEHHFYTVTALSNLHAGSGDISYGLVDKSIQRDATTDLPTVHASSLKGALREYFEVESGMTQETVNSIFGSKNGGENTSVHQAGSYRFFSMDLLSLPVRSSGYPFHRAVSGQQLQSVKERLDVFGLNSFDKAFKELIEEGKKDSDQVFDLRKAVIESYEVSKSRDLKHKNDAESLLGEQLALLSFDHFQNLVKNLPVIARNHLESGESQNLWYEEIVPRETRFITVISAPNGLHSEFDLDEKIVQIGANASIGYGLCQFKEIKREQEDGNA